jgi:hypothetical protein
VFQNNVYNYTYRQTATGTSSFLIEQVEGITPDTLKAASNKLKDLKSKLLKNADSKVDTAEYIRHIDSVSFYIDKGLKMFGSSNNHIDSLLSSIKIKLGADTAKKDSLKKNTLLNITEALNQVKSLSQQVVNDHQPLFISDLTIENFKTIFKLELGRLISQDVVKNNNKELDKLATDKYVEITARIKFKDDQPLTAFLQLLSKQVNVFVSDNEDDPKFPPIVLNIDDIQCEFESGTIKNIYAQFSSTIDPQQKFFFQNTIPISISGKFAETQFSKIRIFAIDSKQFSAAYKGRTDLNYGHIYFNLGQVIRYVLFLETQKEDYSPEDNVYYLSNLQTSVELKKQLRSKILTVKSFTDFNGLHGDKPNGLIQFEASIHANVVTYHKQIGKTNFAFFPGADLLYTLNKIDDNNKYLQLTTNELDQKQLANNVKMFGVHPIDLLKYQSSGININTNLIKYGIPDFATSMSLNGSYGILQTSVSDSLIVDSGKFTKTATPNNRSVYSRNLILNASIDFSPDSRYGFRVCYGLSWLWVNDQEVHFAEGTNNRLAMLEFSGFLKTSDNSKMFFRWRTSHEFHSPQYNYNQIQVGFLVDIFKATK